MSDATKIVKDISLVVVRLSDGAMFEPSHAPGFGTEQAVHNTLSGIRTFYFIRVHYIRPPIWKFWSDGHWERVDEVWEPPNTVGCKILPGKELKRGLRKGVHPPI